MKAKTGDKVQVHYTGTLSDGTKFDSSEGREPLEFTLGQHQVIPGFEDAVTGMAVGEKKKITIPADKAYGPPRKELVHTVPKDQFPENVPLEKGGRLALRAPTGHVIPAVILEVADKTVTIDMNPPLAGKDLTFELELIKVR